MSPPRSTRMSGYTDTLTDDRALFPPNTENLFGCDRVKTRPVETFFW
jgi:hypothetical protein